MYVLRLGAMVRHGGRDTPARGWPRTVGSATVAAADKILKDCSREQDLSNGPWSSGHLTVVDTESRQHTRMR